MEQTELSIAISPVLFSVPSPVKEHDGRDRPHIVLMVDQFPKALGGGERVLLKLAALLPRYGFSVSIVTFSIHPESDLLSDLPECPLYILPLTDTGGPRSLRVAVGFSQFLRQRRARIVQTFFESSDLWGGIATKMLSRARLIWSRRDMGILRSRKHSRAYRLLSFLPDRVFVVSERVRRQSVDIDRIDPSRVRTIYNGLDSSPMSCLPRADRPGDTCLHIATVGNIRPVKGHDILIRAAAIVISQFPNVRFTIAGKVLDQRYYEELVALVEKLCIADRFHFAGGVSDTAEFLQSVDIFTLPSRSEGFSNSIIEAMAACLPVVATNVGGNAEAIAHGRTGLIVPKEDENALAAALLALCEDRLLAAQMGTAGQKRVDECFTTAMMVEKTVAEYRVLLGF